MARKKEDNVEYLNDKKNAFKMGKPQSTNKSREEKEVDYIKNEFNKRYSLGNQYYTVFRVGAKFKNEQNSDVVTIDKIGKFIYHSNRTANTIKNEKLREKVPPNVDLSRTHLNRILIGSENIKEDAMMYLEGVKIAKNSVLAREIVMSAGNGFWNKLSAQDKERWISAKYNFLKKYFGDNCVYALLHLDETTPHVHALIIPVMANKKGIPHLNNSFYFDGKDKLSKWQDVYTNAMTDEFQALFKRGIRNSKSTHVELQTFYALVKEDLKEASSDVILAHAKENFINRKRVNELEETIKDKDEIIRLTEEIIKKNKELKETKKLYEYVIRNLADKYNIPSNEVAKIIENKDKFKDNSNVKDRQREREK